MKNEKGYEPKLAFYGSIVALISLVGTWITSSSELDYSIIFLSKEKEIPAFEKKIISDNELRHIKWSASFKIINNSDQDLIINNLIFRTTAKRGDFLLSNIRPNAQFLSNLSKKINYPIHISPRSSEDFKFTFLIDVYQKLNIQKFDIEHVDSLNLSLPQFWGLNKNESYKSVPFGVGVKYFEDIKKLKIKTKWFNFVEDIDFYGEKTENGAIHLPREVHVFDKIGIRTKESPLSSFCTGTIIIPPNNTKKLEELKNQVIFNPSDINSTLSLYSYFVLTGDFQQATTLMNEFQPQTKFQTAQIKHNLGVIEIARKNYEKGIGYFEEAIKADKCFFMPYDNIYELYMWQGDYNASRAIARRFILECDKNLDAWANRLYTQTSRTENIDTDIQCYKRAIYVNPSNGNNYFFLGSVMLKKEDFAQSIQLIEKALKIGTHSSFRASALNNLSSAYIEVNNYTKAKEILEVLTSEFPEYWRGHFNLAYLCFEMKDYNYAIEQYQKTINLKPDSKEAFEDLGHIYEHLGNIELAKKYYEKAKLLSGL